MRDFVCVSKEYPRILGDASRIICRLLLHGFSLVFPFSQTQLWLSFSQIEFIISSEIAFSVIIDSRGTSVNSFPCLLLLYLDFLRSYAFFIYTYIYIY